MALDFFVEFSQTLFLASPVWDFHASLSFPAGSRTLAIASESCAQRERSETRCFLPPAWSRYPRTRCLFSEPSQEAAIHASPSSRCSAGYSEPVSTRKISPEL